MGEALSQEPEQVLHQKAVDELILYLRANRSAEYKQPDDPHRDEGDAHYLKFRILGSDCGVETAQLFEEASMNLDGTIEVPHRLSGLKDELSEAVRERCVFH